MRCELYLAREYFRIPLNLSKTMLLLYKPQYEVGIQAKRNKKGVIKDTKII